MNITQTTHSAKNVHGKNPWPSGDLNPGPLACGASALPTELPGRRDKPGRTKYLQWYRGHGTQYKHINRTRPTRVRDQLLILTRLQM